MAFFKGFKPQRGKFTHRTARLVQKIHKRFKPQRGKFTRKRQNKMPHHKTVSNPNGVNLHNARQTIDNGAVNGFKPQRGKFTQILRKRGRCDKRKFQTPTG